MNQEEFIDAIKIAVSDSAQKSMKSILIEPAGRYPDKENIEQCKWYNNLSNVDKGMIEKVIKKTAEMTLFGFFCVLDGVRAIENGRNKGELSLYYTKDDTHVFLNDPKAEFLHDLWKGVI